jgi:hypothetical protein
MFVRGDGCSTKKAIIGARLCSVVCAGGGLDVEGGLDVDLHLYAK